MYGPSGRSRCDSTENGARPSGSSRGAALMLKLSNAVSKALDGPPGPVAPCAPVGPWMPIGPCGPVAPASPADARTCHEGFAPGLLNTQVDGTLGFTQPLGGMAAVAIQLDPSAATTSFGTYDDEPLYAPFHTTPAGPVGPATPSSPFFARRFQKSGFGGAAALMQTFPIGAGPQPPATGAIATHDEPRYSTASSIA